MSEEKVSAESLRSGSIEVSLKDLIAEDGSEFVIGQAKIGEKVLLEDNWSAKNGLLTKNFSSDSLIPIQYALRAMGILSYGQNYGTNSANDESHVLTINPANQPKNKFVEFIQKQASARNGEVAASR